METIPVFQASIILNNVLCGGIIFQEFYKYTFGNMCILFVGFCICMVGIAVIIMKNNMLSKSGVEEASKKAPAKYNSIQTPKLKAPAAL
jgi:hypothetical protein